MKKLSICMLCVVLLFGCNSSAGSNSSNSPSNTTDKDGSRSIDFNDVVLVEDDYATVTLINFFEKKWYDHTDACFTLKVTNNLERDIMFNVNDGYLEDISVQIGLMDGNRGPKPGKTGEYSYSVKRKKGGEVVPLESIDELYDLNGIIEILVYSEDGSRVGQKKEFDFDFSKVK